GVRAQHRHQPGRRTGILVRQLPVRRPAFVKDEARVVIAASKDPAVSDRVGTKPGERRALAVACGAHALHDGYTDLIWVALPIWQAEFALSYAAVGLLRTIFSGTMASLQIPSSLLADRFGRATVLAIGTALCGLCYGLAGLSDGFAWLVAALL